MDGGVMNDLFSEFLASSNMKAAAIAGPSSETQEADRPGKSALSPSFISLAARADKMEARDDFRDAFAHPHRTGNLMRALRDEFPDSWERARVAEILDRVPARLLIELVGRPQAEKVADALRFPVSQLLEN